MNISIWFVTIKQKVRRNKRLLEQWGITGQKHQFIISRKGFLSSFVLKNKT